MTSPSTAPTSTGPTRRRSAAPTSTAPGPTRASSSRRGTLHDGHFFGVAVSGANIYWAFQETGRRHSRSPDPIDRLREHRRHRRQLRARHGERLRPGARRRPRLLDDLGRHRQGQPRRHRGAGGVHSGVRGPGGRGRRRPRLLERWRRGHIGRANLDGSGVEPGFIAGVGARDVAVDGLPPGSPATSSCPPPPPPPPPDNSFSLGKLKRNLKKGTAKLTVKVPGPGELRLREDQASSQGHRAGRRDRQGPAQGPPAPQGEVKARRDRQGQGQRPCQVHADRGRAEHRVEEGDVEAEAALGPDDAKAPDPPKDDGGA